MASLISTIQAALASVSSSLPDAVRKMTHGTETGDAISVSSTEIGGESASDSGAVEKSRVIVTAANFPTLDRDDLVTIGGVPYVTTSLRKDPVAASATVGLSEPLSKISADYLGTRGSRRIHFPIDILAENNGKSTFVPDEFSSTDVYYWTIVVPADAWPEASIPAIGDELRFTKDSDHRVRVSNVVNKQKHFILTARSR